MEQPLVKEKLFDPDLENVISLATVKHNTVKMETVDVDNVSSLAVAGIVKMETVDVDNVSQLDAAETVKMEPVDVDHVRSLDVASIVKMEPANVDNVSSLDKAGTENTEPAHVDKVSSLDTIGIVKMEPTDVRNTLNAAGTVKMEPADVANVSSMDAAITVKTEPAHMDCDVNSLEQETIIEVEINIEPTVILPPNFEYTAQPCKPEWDEATTSNYNPSTMLRLANEREKTGRENHSQETPPKILIIDAASLHEPTNQMTPEKLATLHIGYAPTQNQYIEQMTCEQSIINEEEDSASRKRRLASESQKRWRSKKTQESRAKIRGSNADPNHDRINQMTPKQLGTHHIAYAPTQNQYIVRTTPEQSITNGEEDPVSRKRRLASERQKRWRSNKSQESLTKIRALDAANHQERLNQMTPEQLSAHRVAHAAAQRRYIERLTSEQLAAYHVAHAAPLEQMTPEQPIMNEDPASRKRRLANERQKRRRSNISQASRAKIRAFDVATHQKRVNQMTPEQLAAHRVAHAAAQRRYIQRMTPEQLTAHRIAHAASQHQYIERRTPKQLATDP